MKNNQKGFSGVEILIVLIVVGLLGAVSWLVYDRQNHKTNTSGTQNAETDTPTSSNNYLTLADFKVRIPLNDKTSGLKLGSVSTSSYNEADKTVPIIAPELDSDWKCDPDPSGNFKGTIGMISITTQAKRSGPYEPLVTKKVGNYTYGFEPGSSNCTDNPAYQKLVDAFKAQFDKLETY